MKDWIFMKWNGVSLDLRSRKRFWDLGFPALLQREISFGFGGGNEKKFFLAVSVFFLDRKSVV